MMAVLMHWFPDRQFILLGDWGFASHDLAWFCHRHRERLTLVARTRSDMNLYALPPNGQRGRAPAAAREREASCPPPPKPSPPPPPRATPDRALVRQQRARAGTAGRLRRLVPRPRAAAGRPWSRSAGSTSTTRESGREDYFYSTDPSLRPEQIVELFAGRWAIEVTFEEVRAHLGFETTRHWCQQLGAARRPPASWDCSAREPDLRRAGPTGQGEGPRHPLLPQERSHLRRRLGGGAAAAVGTGHFATYARRPACRTITRGPSAKCSWSASPPPPDGVKCRSRGNKRNIGQVAVMPMPHRIKCSGSGAFGGILGHGWGWWPSCAGCRATRSRAGCRAKSRGLKGWRTRSDFDCVGALPDCCMWDRVVGFAALELFASR